MSAQEQALIAAWVALLVGMVIVMFSNLVLISAVRDRCERIGHPLTASALYRASFISPLWREALQVAETTGDRELLQIVRIERLWRRGYQTYALLVLAIAAVAYHTTG